MGLLGQVGGVGTSILRERPTRLISARASCQEPHDPQHLDPAEVMRSLQVQASATRNPALTVADILASLERCDAWRFAEAARAQTWRLESSQVGGGGVAGGVAPLSSADR